VPASSSVRGFVAVIIVATAFLTAALTAQTPPAGPITPTLLNSQAPGIDDLLALDAIPDLIVSPSAGAAVSRIISGATLAELGAGFPFGPSFSGGVRMALGDLSGDGVADIVAGMGPGGGLVLLLDGNNAAVLGSGYPFGTGFAGGVSVAVGDINGDGRNDIVAAPATGGGTVFAVNGIDYSLLFEVAPFGGGYAGGMNVATGDIDGDGRADIIVGQSNGGAAAIIGAASQAVTASAAPFGNVNGVFVAAGDVNNDGRAEVIAAPGSGNGPVLIYDASAQALLAAPVPYPAGFSGGVRVAATDLTGDGRVEIITAPGPGIAPVLKIYDGATFANTHSIPAYPATFTSGTFVAAAASVGLRFTSVPTATFTAGTAGTFTVRAAGTPVPRSITLSGALPSGVTFTNNGDGTATLAGTPSAGSGGAYPLTFTATNNSSATVTQAFALNVNQAPAITSAAFTAFAQGAAGSFSVTTTALPRPTLVQSGALPPGVTFTDNGDGTGTLAGTPSSDGSFPITFTASNGVGAAAVQSFTLIVNGTPTFTSAATASFTTSTPGTFTITATGAPLPTLGIAGTLPAGVSFLDNGNGTATLAGTPGAATGGSYALTLSANNGIGSPVTQNFTLTVAQAPAITSGNTASFAVSQTSSFTITTTGFPAVSLNATGPLPAGVTFVPNSNGTATLAGTPGPATQGSYPLLVTASNGVGTAATQNFTLSVAACTTGVTLTPAAGALTAGTFNTAYSQTIGATGGSGHTFAVAAGTLPPGLTLSAGGGLTGTPSETSAASFSFTVMATAANGCSGVAAYTLAIAPNAQGDTYSNGVGNTQFSVGAAAPGTPAVLVSGTILTNDSGSGSLSVGPVSIASTNGGSVALSTNGTFLYTPPVGFAGPSDTFTYTLTDGNGATDSAVVTINMSGVVWYVNAAAAAGDGRSQAPFDTMSAAAAAAQINQTIYVHPGAPTGATSLKTGQLLQGAGETFTFSGLTIAAGAAPTLQNTITMANGAAVRALSVNAPGVGAIVATGLTGAESLTNVTITGGATGLNLTALGGTFTVTGGAISGITPGAAVSITGGAGTISIGSSVTALTNRSVQVQSHTGGTITLSGAISDTGAGVLLDSNGGTAIGFTGGLAIDTAANAAFVATGGGTITATQNNTTIVNTIDTTSATALQVLNTAIGSAGLTFRRISADSSNGSSAVGIWLEGTGLAAGNGGLTVTGTGTAASGGRIRSKTGPDGSLTQGVGIYLNSTKDVSLSWLEMFDFDNAGIVGRNVSGFLLANSTIDFAGNTAAAFEGPIVFGRPDPGGVNGLVGSGVLRNMQITGGVEHNIAFYNQSGSMSLQVENTTGSPGGCQISFNSPISGDRGVLIQLEGSAIGTASVSNCLIHANRKSGIMATASNTAALTVAVNATEVLYRGQGDAGIVLENGDDASMTATITGNSIAGFPISGIHLGQTSTASSLSRLRATISGNLLDSGVGATGPGIAAYLTGAAGQQAPARLLFASNGVSQNTQIPGILVDTPTGGTSPVVDVTIDSNHVDMKEYPPSSGLFGPSGLVVRSTQPAGRVCASINLNSSHWYPTTVGVGGGIAIEQSAGGAFELEQGGESLGTPAVTVLANNNTAGAYGPSTAVANGSFTIVGNGTCLLPTAP